MKLGILAYSSETGLGYQTKSYYKHLNPSKVMLVDLSKLNGTKQNNDWYKAPYYVDGYPSKQQIDNFLLDLDVMLFAETPLNYYFYQRARELGIKTAVVINWEFFDHILYPDKPLPDLFIMPSIWHLADMMEFGIRNKVKVKQIHHPVDREEMPFRIRNSKHFVHIAGKFAAHDRNGTFDYLHAMPDGRVTTQSHDLINRLSRRYNQARIFQNITESKMLYDHGDILVLPRRYGGNCLPMNEALSCGMPVIMPDISPNNHILPKEWLVKAKKYDSFTPRTSIDIYAVDQEDLRQRLDYFRNCDINEESRKADKIADSISWKTLKQKYIEALESLCVSYV